MGASQTRSASLSELTTLEFRALLQTRHIHLYASGDRLKATGPAGAIDSSLQAELAHRKQALLTMLKQEGSASALVPLDADTLRRRLPLTPAQQGMWLIDHFDPGNVAYNIPEAFRLEESVDLKIFQAAVDRLLARHRILRTSFHEDEGELFHLIHPVAEATVGFTDLSILGEEEADRRCRELIREEGRKPFHLDQAPLVRFHVFRLAMYRHVIFANVHHIIADRISLYVLRKELIALSKAIGNDDDAELPAVPIQYSDYAVWTTSETHRDTVKRQLDYWKRKLADLGPPVELPHSLTRPEKRSSWGAGLPVAISTAERIALLKIGLEERASPFMTFLALFALLIARIARSGGRDFCIGSPITSRRHPATADMIGLFVNMLVFRCQIQTRQSFREILKDIRLTALEAYDNSDAPFQSVVKALKPDRRAQRSPIFQVMFGYETYQPRIANELQMDADPGTARYDLSLHLAETESEGLTGSFEFCTDLFTNADVAKIKVEFEALIASTAQAAEDGALPPST